MRGIFTGAYGFILGPAILVLIVLSLVAVIPGNAQEASVNDTATGLSAYIVVFNDTNGIGTALSHIVSSLAGAGGGSVKYNYDIINGMAVTLPDSVAGRLQSMPGVKYVEKEQQAHVLLSDSIPIIGANLARYDGYDGKGVKVGIVDTGVDASHPDLNNGKVVAWKDFVKNSSSPYDDNGHGTHVSSIVAGTGNASNGKYTGVAPGASLIEAKVISKYGIGDDSNIIAGIQWAVNNGAQVISLSVGTASVDPALDDAVNNVVKRGIPVVVAAGNSGPGSATIDSPGDASGAITVGAVDKSDIIASFSSRGPVNGSLVKPDVVNVGVNVVAARAWGTTTLGSSPINSYYTMMSGTSMSSPMTTGVVALMLERNPRLTPGQVKSILEHTAEPIGGLVPNNAYGWGRIRANYAVDNSSYGSAYISDTLPASPGTVPDTTQNVSVTMKAYGLYNWSNNSNVTLHALGDAARIGDAIAYMPAGVSITPGQEYTWTVNLHVPIADGMYNLSYRMFVNNTPFGETIARTIWAKGSVNPGTLQFNCSTYDVLKTSGSMSIQVDRVGGSDNAVCVDYATCDGSATAWEDYAATCGTLSFSQGQTHATFSVPILNDGVYGGENKTLRVSLYSPSGGASIGLSSADITIIDNNPRPDNHTSFALSLERGWNLVSSPLVANPPLDVSVFNGAGVTIAARYNLTTCGFDVYRVGKTPAAFPFEAGQGYFLYCNNATTYTIAGYDEPGQSATVYYGWNLVGWTSLTASDSRSLAAGLCNVTMLAKYDTTTGGFDIYRAGKTPTPFSIVPGEGYFLYTTYSDPQALTMG